MNFTVLPFIALAHLFQRCLSRNSIGAFSPAETRAPSTSFAARARLAQKESLNSNLNSLWLASSRTYPDNPTAAPLAMTMTGSVESDKKLMQDILYRIRDCNDIPDEIRKTCMNFEVDGIPVGKVTQKVAQLLCDSSPTEFDEEPVFQMIMSSDDGQETQTLTLSESAGATAESRTDAVMTVMANLKSKGIVTGWRDELYPVSPGFYDEPVFFVERAAAPFLGILQYGVHINGLVQSEDSEMMWVARRSATKATYPSMTDQIVAGGQPAGLGLMENVLKECQEEAGIPDELTKRGIKAIGAVSYETVEPSLWEGSLLTRMVLFNYDLKLPPDFKPKAVDGEVEEFLQWDVQEQFASMAKDYHDPMKPNCYLCVIDYLLREGHISPEAPGYLDVLRELRSGDCV